MRLRVILLGLFITVVFAQPPLVKSIVTVFGESSDEFYHPLFSPDGSRLLLTKPNYRGLYEYSLDSGQLIIVSDEMGAGYEAKYSGDGKAVYFRTGTIKNRRNYYSLFSYDLTTGERSTLASGKRELSPPKKSTIGRITYILKDDVRELEPGSQSREADSGFPQVQIYKSKSLKVIKGSETKIIQPRGKRLYLWSSVSPGGDKLLFTVAGMGTFISDLDGNILVDLGQANVPSWSPDGEWVVFMHDTDDGYRFTESDIYLASSDGRTVRNITNTPDIIELYPNWSQAGDKIVCSTDNGVIYIINLEW